jgi:hypothetical protein
MIDGLRDEPELRDKQIQFLIARQAMRQHILENALRALYLFDKPKNEEELANAALSLESAIAETNDPGKVLGFLNRHPLLPESMT